MTLKNLKRVPSARMFLPVGPPVAKAGSNALKTGFPARRPAYHPENRAGPYPRNFKHPFDERRE